MTFRPLSDDLWKKIDEMYESQDNFLVADTASPASTNERICAIYFSGNGLYFPKTSVNFEREVVVRNRFEWFGTRILRASRHIFLRDLRMRWYLNGISSRLNTIDRVADFLRERTAGCRTICVGSSAGGYAALLFSSLLGSDACFAFSPCIDVARSICLNRGLIGESEYWDERYADCLSLARKYNDLTELLRQTPACHRYVYAPVQSVIDRPEYASLRELPGFRFLRIDSAVHGLDIPRESVARLINLDCASLEVLYDDARCWNRLALLWRLSKTRNIGTAVRLAAEELRECRRVYLRKRFYANLFILFQDAVQRRFGV